MLVFLGRERHLRDALRRQMALLLIIRVLGSVLEDPGELDVVKLPVLDGSLFVHVVDLVVREAVTKGGQYLTKVILVKHPSIGVIETGKSVSYYIFRISALQPFAKQGEKHGKVDGAWSLTHHLVQVFITHLLSKGGEHVPEVIVIDEPVPVLVDHVEGLLKLLDLVLVEHGKDVGGGALSALLGAGPTGRLPARHPDAAGRVGLKAAVTRNPFNPVKGSRETDSVPENSDAQYFCGEANRH